MSRCIEESSVVPRDGLDEFYFFWDQREDDLCKIMELKVMMNIEKLHLKSFSIVALKWDFELLGVLVAVFQYFAEKGLVWDMLGIKVMSPSDYYFVGPFLHSANGFNLFRDLNVVHETRYRDSVFEDGLGIFGGIGLNKNLVCVCVFLVGDRLVSDADCRALKECLVSTSTLKRLELRGLGCRCSSYLARGLVANNTLTKLVVSFDDYGPMVDDNCNLVISALCGHPKLKEFSMECVKKMGKMCSCSLSNVLGLSRSLTTIDLAVNDDIVQMADSVVRFLDVDLLVRGLRLNRILQCLLLDNVLIGEGIFAKVFEALHCCANVWLVKLHQSNLTGQDVEEVASLMRLERPVLISLSSQMLLQHERVIELVLTSHPELRIHMPDFFRVQEQRSLSERFIHQVDWNFYGRYLLDGGDSVPLSLWPVVFERCNSKCSVLYEFVKSPSFLESLLKERDT